MCRLLSTMSILQATTLTVSLLLLLVTQALCELGVDPVQLAVEPGEEAVLTCEWLAEENSTKTGALRWVRVVVLAAQTDEIVVTNSTRVTVVGGTLTITNVSFADAGDYRCQDDVGTEPATSELIVYDMPDYTTEWLVVGGVIVALVALLVVGLGLKSRQDKLRRRARRRLLHGEDGQEGGSRS